MAGIGLPLNSGIWVELSWGDIIRQAARRGHSKLRQRPDHPPERKFT
jgi:hypothetical protein